MKTKSIALTAIVVVMGFVGARNFALAESFVDHNSNVVGVTPPGEYRGIPAMQDNEATCANNPLVNTNIVCAWNASGGADDLIGDTWIRMSETMDLDTWFNRYINGSLMDLENSINQQFAADPVTFCWPGGCGIVMLASTRLAAGGGQGGGIYMQRMLDTNVELGSRKRLEEGLVQVYRSTGSHFADKPWVIYMLDEQNPGTVSVTMTIEGSAQPVTRFFPKARILVAFALFNPSKNDIEILSMFTDNYGDSWSSARQVAVSSGRDQGISLAAIDRTVLYTFRRFADDGDTSALMGAVSNRWGQTIGKPFAIVDPFCPYDVPTLPNASNQDAAASRTNAFPSVSENGSNFILAYQEKQLVGGNCVVSFDDKTDSRVKVIVGSPNGKNWGTPVEIAPNTGGHGFQFQPAVHCARGGCQVAYWDTRLNSMRTIEFLQGPQPPGQPPGFAQGALTAFLNYPIFADFNYQETPGGLIMQFRNTADVFTTGIEIQSALTAVPTDNPPVQVSRYRQGLVGGQVRQLEFNPFHIKGYRTSSVPFMSDYISVSSNDVRLSFDPQQPENPPFWESNSSADPLNDDVLPEFWVAFVDARNVRGQIYAENVTDTVPYMQTGGSASTTEPENPAIDPEAADDQTATAENVEDFNPEAVACVRVDNPPGAGELFIALNNRTKDFDIYGTMIRRELSARSFNPTKTLGNIQRSYTIVADNFGLTARTFRFEIANQPVGSPTAARAAWQQLPFDPSVPAFQAPPDPILLVDVEPRSSAAAALFLVSLAPVNPVTVNVYDNDDVNDKIITTITVDGAVEAGPFLNANGLPNNFEIHDPEVIAPLLFTNQFNPDQYNPDLFNPDLYNPDQFNPDQFNPDLFNPDQYNPDQFNPDQFNPDQFNPDQFNPDLFNPDLFNPDQFNTNLTDDAQLDNPEIPDPSGITGLVSKIDINYAVVNKGNTITPYTVDFAIGDAEILQMLANGEIVTQLIAWQDKHVSDVQFCEPRLISENVIVAAVNNPDLANFTIPNIANNRLGELTFVVFPNDVMQTTLRIIGPTDKIQTVANKLPDDIISWVFASQVANTNNIDLGVDEQEINDRRPPQFLCSACDGNMVSFEADGPAGTTIDVNLVTAADIDATPLTVDCVPALGSTIGLDIFNGGPTMMSCSATNFSNGVTGTLELDISVLDTIAPIFDADPLPDVTAEATGPGGANVTFSTPAATDLPPVDLSVNVSCDATSGDLFPIGSTTVSCTATDASGNSEPPSTFQVIVADVTAPVITLNGAPSVTIASHSGPYVDAGATATDNADGNVSVDIDASEVDTDTPGTYTVHFSATDNAGNIGTATRMVIVEFAYAGGTGIDPNKTTMKIGSSNPLLWAWLDADNNPVDSSGDVQLLRIEDCDNGDILLQVAGDPGTSGFRYKTDNFWQFNLTGEGNKGDRICAIVESSLTGQVQTSPPIRLR